LLLVEIFFGGALWFSGAQQCHRSSAGAIPAISNLNFAGGNLCSCAMSSALFQVRRATVDDLPALTALWQAMGFPVAELNLEKRLTEFQVAVAADGRLLGAVALETAGSQGRIHHEAFEDFGLADQLRPLFWEKFRMLAQNNSVFRLWTQENAPFWKQSGLQAADRAVLQKLPAKWTNAGGGWLTLQLKDEAAIQAVSVDQEFAALMQAEREQIAARAVLFKKVGMVAALLFALLVGALILYVFRRDPAILQNIGSGLRGR
jgi:N-acetylglutamate synthase-like GNAT family acetyltransferase